MLFEHALRPVTEAKVNISDNPLAHARCAIGAALAHRRDPVDKFRLAERLQRFVAGRPIHRPALDKHARDDVVAGSKISQQLVQ